MLALMFVVLTVPRPDVVELETGYTVTGRIKSTEPEVRVLTPGGEKVFEQVHVRGIRTRRELLQTFRATRRRVGDSLRGHLALAEFCLEKGLYDELFDCLDDAAAIEPGHSGVADLTERASGAVLIGDIVPYGPYGSAEIDRLLLAVGGSSPSRAHIALGWLEDRPEDELLPVLDQRIRHPRSDVRQASARVLAALRAPASLRPLIRSSLVDSDAGVRIAALEGVLGYQHPDLAVPYIRAATSADHRLRAHAYPALDALLEPRAVPVLISLLEPGALEPPSSRTVLGGGSGPGPRGYVEITEQITFLQDFDVEIAQGAAIADPVVGVLQQGAVLEASAIATSRSPMAERRVIRRILRRSTGIDYGEEWGLWEQWWKESGARFIADRAAKPAALPVDQD